jgi:hypothetical protein
MRLGKAVPRTCTCVIARIILRTYRSVVAGERLIGCNRFRTDVDFAEWERNLNRVVQMLRDPLRAALRSAFIPSQCH